MKRYLPACLLLALLLSLPAAASASVTSVSVGVALRNAPPPPVVVFRSEPRLVMMPHTSLAYYEGPGDYDYFHYGSFFYIYNGGYWYRSPHYRGPFVAIRESYVPTIFYGLHDRGYHWRHGWRNAPPGQVRRVVRRQDRREDRREERREDRHERKHDRGRGHGHGHDKD